LKLALEDYQFVKFNSEVKKFLLEIGQIAEKYLKD